MIKDVRWSGWVWVGECFFSYRPTRVVSDQRPLNGCVRRCVPHVWKLIWLLTQGRAIYWQITWIIFIIEAPKCIVNRPIRVGDSKNVIVFDPVPMVTCFGACTVHSTRFQWCPVKVVLTHITQQWIDIASSNLVAGLTTWSAMYDSCSGSNSHRSGSRNVSASRML